MNSRLSLYLRSAYRRSDLGPAGNSRITLDDERVKQ